MDNDDDLRRAVSVNAAFALVRVASVQRRKGGTRSQVAVYQCELLCAIEEVWPSNPSIAHFGVPALAVDRCYVVGASDNGRHNEAWEVRFAAAADEAPAAAVAAFLARRRACMGVRE